MWFCAHHSHRTILWSEIVASSCRCLPSYTMSEYLVDILHTTGFTKEVPCFPRWFPFPFPTYSLPYGQYLSNSLSISQYPALHLKTVSTILVVDSRPLTGCCCYLIHAGFSTPYVCPLFPSLLSGLSSECPLVLCPPLLLWRQWQCPICSRLSQKNYPA